MIFTSDNSVAVSSEDAAGDIRASEFCRRRRYGHGADGAGVAGSQAKGPSTDATW
jgi:hypothetical protein